MTSLPPALLDQLLTELSTLASVYHKPPETFVGQGRYGADAIQHAAIQEQRQDAVDNPIAATANTSKAAQGNNAENLLDIDFDGAAPASTEGGGLEGLAGTPQRVESPAMGSSQQQQQGQGSIADMMGLFDMNGSSSPAPAGGQHDIMNSFAGLDLGGASQPPSAGQQLHSDGGAKKTNDDLLGMF